MKKRQTECQQRYLVCDFCEVLLICTELSSQISVLYGNDNRARGHNVGVGARMCLEALINVPEKTFLSLPEFFVCTKNLRT